MTDIVWSLKAAASHPDAGPGTCRVLIAEALEAVREIEKLRAENERLRSALGKVAIGNGDPQFTACAALGFENGL